MSGGAGVGALRAPQTPALLVGKVHHTRFSPLRHSFTHAHHQLLVDVGEPFPAETLPRWMRPFLELRSEDHLAGAPGRRALAENVHRVLRRKGISSDPDSDRVLMLANARVLGHVFDPMSAFYVFAADGRLRGVVVEVHNTYAGRHAYALEVTEDGRAAVDKDFYVSPFNEVEGDYEIGFRLDPTRLAVTIQLFRDGERALIATISGRLQPATKANLLRALARNPFAPQRVSALIRMHGIYLWARRLPVVRRSASSMASVR